MAKLKFRHKYSWGYGPWRTVEVHEEDYEVYQDLSDREMGQTIIDEIDFDSNPFRAQSLQYRGVEWEWI